MDETLNELDAWRDLLKSSGFQLLRLRARTEWGAEGYGRKMKHAVEKARTDGTDRELAIDKVDAASDAVNVLMSYPEERIGQLTEAVIKKPFWEKRRA